MRLSNLTEISGLGWPSLVGLEEVRADRRLHRVDEATQDAVLVQALDFLQLLFDACGNCALLVAATLSRRAGRSGRETIQRRRPQCRHVSPASSTCSPANRARESGAGSATASGSAQRRARQAAVQRERVVTVILGPPRITIRKAVSSLAPPLSRSIVPPPARSSSMSCNQTPAPSLRFNVIGALVHDAEAHVFQDRARARTAASGRAKLHTFRPTLHCCLPQADDGNQRLAGVASDRPSITRMSPAATAGA